MYKQYCNPSKQNISQYYILRPVEIKKILGGGGWEFIKKLLARKMVQLKSPKMHRNT